MSERPGPRRWGMKASLVVTALAITIAGDPTESAGRKQSEALADLTARIVACSIHPCLGDDVKAVREALHGAILTDDLFYYSDVAVAYPSVSGTLHGLVEWDLDGPLEGISLKITGFQDSESIVAALESALPGCEMDGEDPTEAVEDGIDDDEIPSNERGCDVEMEEGDGASIDLFTAPGMVMVDIY